MSHSPTSDYYNQTTDRLIFRSFEQEDIRRWEPFFIDNPTLVYLGAALFEHLSALEKSESWISRQIDRQKNNQFGQLAAIDKETGELIGVGGIIYRELEAGDEYEITYSLMPKAWGKGLGTELAVHFKNYAKNVVGLKSVISIIHVDNEASINVAKKNGMVKESEFEFMEMPVVVYRARF
jgi:ribosomal-protein-alanine N-acetyltransferase